MMGITERGSEMIRSEILTFFFQHHKNIAIVLVVELIPQQNKSFSSCLIKYNLIMNVQFIC